MKKTEYLRLRNRLFGPQKYGFTPNNQYPAPQYFAHQPAKRK